MLEVILAIAILGMALVVIGELLRVGFRSAADAQQRSEAQMACDSKMAEVVSGVLPLESVSGGKIEEFDGWEYDVMVDDGQFDGLLQVKVTVRQVGVQGNSITFEVTRFVPDPDYDPDELQQ